MMGRLLPQYYYAPHGKYSANDVIIIQPIVSEILWDLTLTLAGGALFPWPSAPILSPHYRSILILRKYFVTYPCYRCGDVSMDMICLVWSHPRTIAIRASHHPYRLTAAGTVI